MDKLKSLQKSTKEALFWGSFEAFIYRFFLLGHQFLLFWSVDKAFYGLQGAFFATVFLAVNLLNGSLCSAMAPLFTVITSSKKQFFDFLKQYVLSQTIILFISTLIIGFLFKAFIPIASFKELSHPIWIVIFACFVASEGTKKNLRSLLQLAFKNSITAKIEVFFIAMYVSIIWISHYFCGIALSLPLLLFPFLFLSIAVNGLLLVEVYKYYTTLPSSLITQKEFSKKELMQNRAFLFINEVSRSVFSSNFLLPFFAYLGGLSQAGVVAFVKEITYSVSFFFQKIFGSSGAALFANTKDLSFESKQTAFSYLNQKCLYVIGSLIVLFALNTPHFLFFKIGSQSLYLWMLVYCFFLAHFLEGLFVVYEKLFIAENKAHYVTIVNLISFGGCFIAAAFLHNYSLIAVLLCCMALRFVAFIGLALCAQKLWDLTLDFNFNLKQISAPFILSAALFAILWWVG